MLADSTSAICSELHDGASTLHVQLLRFEKSAFNSVTQLWHEDGWRLPPAKRWTLHIDQSGPRVPDARPILWPARSDETAHADVTYILTGRCRKIGLKR